MVSVLRAPHCLGDQVRTLGLRCPSLAACRLVQPPAPCPSRIQPGAQGLFIVWMTDTLAAPRTVPGGASRSICFGFMLSPLPATLFPPASSGQFLLIFTVSASRPNRRVWLTTSWLPSGEMAFLFLESHSTTFNMILALRGFALITQKVRSPAQMVSVNKVLIPPLGCQFGLLRGGHVRNSCSDSTSPFCTPKAGVLVFIDQQTVSPWRAELKTCS